MKFILDAHPEARQRAAQAVQAAPAGHVVTIKPPTRNLEQNAKFHALCSVAEQLGMRWAGKARTAEQWKVLFVSGHAMATKAGFDMVPGLEGEFVNLRESTALMSKARSSSLIEYAQAYIAQYQA